MPAEHIGNGIISKLSLLWSVNLGRSASSSYRDLDSNMLEASADDFAVPDTTIPFMQCKGVGREPDRHKIGSSGVDCAAAERWSEGRIRRRETGPSQKDAMKWKTIKGKEGSAVGCGAILPLWYGTGSINHWYSTKKRFDFVTCALPLPRFESLDYWQLA